MFDKIAGYYEKGLWTIKQVHAAVGKWITSDEYKVITGEEYK